VFSSTFGHVQTCVYMSRRLNESFVSSSRGSSACPWYTVDGKMSDKNLEQRINIKFCVKGQRFADPSDIQRNVKTVLRDIRENDFQDCCRQGHCRLTKYVATQGEYFEGDSSSQCTGKQILLSYGHSGN